MSMMFLIPIITNSSIPSNTLIAICTSIYLLYYITKNNPFIIDKKQLNYGIKIWIALFIIFALIFWKNGTGENEYEKNIIHRGLILLAVTPIALIITTKYRESIIKTIYYLLATNIILFFIQFIYSNLTGSYLDYLGILGIRNSRPELYLNFGLGFIKYRCTGIFHEPGTYASIITLIYCSIKLGKSKINKIFIYLGIISLVLTGSGFGMLGAIIIVAMFKNEIIIDRKKSNLALKIFWGLFFIIVVYVATTYFMYRFSANDFISSGYEFRTRLLNKLYESNLQELITGRPLSEREIFVNSYTLYESYTEDNSLLFFIIYHTGIIGLLSILFPFISSKNTKNIAWIISGLLMKNSIFSYIIWLIVMPLASQKKQTEKN